MLDLSELSELSFYERWNSELRMLKAVVDEHGSSALRLKDAYLNNPKRTEQLLDTFPMSSVLKKVGGLAGGGGAQVDCRKGGSWGDCERRGGRGEGEEVAPTDGGPVEKRDVHPVVLETHAVLESVVEGWSVRGAGAWIEIA